VELTEDEGGTMTLKATDMSKLFSRLLIIAMAVMAVACGQKTEFRINGTIDGFGTGNLRLVYYDGTGMQSLIATAIDGKFSVTGQSRGEVFVRVFANSGKVMGRLLITPGETVDVIYNLTDETMMTVKGNSDSQQLADFLSANAAIIKRNDSRALNTAVDKYVTANSKRITSGVLLADFYNPEGHELRALELINALEREPREVADLGPLRDLLQLVVVPADSIRLEPMRLFGPGDTLSEFSPKSARVTVITVTNHNCRNVDSITNAQELILAANPHNLQMADISCDLDTTEWKNSLDEMDEDSKLAAKIRHYWSASPFNIPQLARMPIRRLPWFVVADSTGRVFYHGGSASRARSAAARAAKPKAAKAKASPQPPS
jgi:hypothetical protein